MPFVRITLMRPRPEVRDEVRSHFEELIRATSRMHGFVRAYVLESPDLSGEIGRVTIWESHADANHAANDPHVMALHSELLLDDRGTLQDWDLEAPVVIDQPTGS